MMRTATRFLIALAILLPASRVAAESAPGYLTQWGTAGTASGQFTTPYGVAVDAAGDVYVADAGNNRIEKFTSNGTYLTGWGTAGTGAGQFNGPTGIAIDAAGNVFVSDINNNRIEKFTTSGAFVAQWGSSGSATGQFAFPYLITVDATGNVYVADYNNNRVQKFSGTGTFLQQFGGLGSGSGQLHNPTAVAVDAAGNVYVSDLTNIRIQKFSSSGAYVTQWGSGGFGNGQFSQVYGIAVNARGNVFVADIGLNRMQEFTSSGAWVATFGSNGTGNGQFRGPMGVTFDATGDLLVVEYSGNRVQKFGAMQEITSVADVTNDQGRRVRLRFTANGLDVPGSGTPITDYAIYRRIDPLPAPAAAAGPRGAASPALARPGSPAPDGAALDGWDFVMTVPAQGDNAYETVAATLADSNSTAFSLSTFLVRAETATPTTWFECAPDSGYSVDNLPPAVPAPFAAAYAGGATHLHWGPSPATDFWYFRLYRGTSAGFTPGPANLIATTGDTTFTDVGPAGGYYKLSAVDLNGNESKDALVTPATTSGVGPAGAPAALDLAAPSPDPAGTTTTLRFGLPADAMVALGVYGVDGRLVREIAHRVFAAGEHALDWDLHDAQGSPVAGGLYFVRLEVAGASRATRLAVVR